MRRVIVAGPRAVVALWKDAMLLPTDDIVRAHQIAPLDLLRTMTGRDDIVLLEGWETDPPTCALVVVGLWLRLAFFRVEAFRLVPCTPRSPVLEFTDANTEVVVS